MLISSSGRRELSPDLLILRQMGGPRTPAKLAGVREPLHHDSHFVPAI